MRQTVVIQQGVSASDTVVIQQNVSASDTVVIQQNVSVSDCGYSAGCECVRHRGHSMTPFC